MKKKEAINIIVDCAAQYRENLVNRNFLFIFGDKQNADTFESAFFTRNFLHLTGVKVQKERFPQSSDFYKKCLKGKLSEIDFDFSSNGSTEMKLAVLMQLMNIHKSAKMVGEYDNSKSLLYTEKMAGNVFGCLGFVREGAFYIPNTAIKEDIRNVTVNPQRRVLAILTKQIREKQYNTITYLAKGITFDTHSLIRVIDERKDIIFQPIEDKEHQRKSLEELIQEAKEGMNDKPIKAARKIIKAKEDREK